MPFPRVGGRVGLDSNPAIATGGCGNPPYAGNNKPHPLIFNQWRRRGPPSPL